jgi:DNA-binding Lrp family transcriptional regulator
MTPRRLRVAGDPKVKAGPTVVRANDPVQAVIRVRLTPTASRRGFEQYLRTLASVLHAWEVTGEVDYELLIACPAIADLDGVLACLRRCGGAEVTSASLVLHEVPGSGEAGLTGHLDPAAEDGRLHGAY